MKKLNLFGFVYPYQEDINAKAIAAFLSTLEKDEEFTVYINSPGGSVFEGLTIYNLLSEYQKNMTIKIIGEASSIASVIACAAAEGKTLIAETGLMLIHEPWTLAIVNKEELKKLEKNLSTVQNSILAAYIRKTGKSAEELNAMMKDELYLGAGDCVSNGFADSVYVPSNEESNLAAESEKVKSAAYNRMFFNSNKNFTPNKNFEKVNNTFTNSEVTMTIEEALTQIGTLKADTANLQAKLTVANVSIEANAKALHDKETELLALKDEKAKLEAKAREQEAANLKLQDDSYRNEALIFCNRMIAAGKMLPSEMNGSADVAKGETPQKVVKLLALRKTSKELYDNEAAEIEARSALQYHSLTEPFGTPPQKPVNGSLDVEDLTSIEAFNGRVK